jgi:hypothetical protein
MSERERWIVYPLIFFALGAAVRDKILQRVEVKEIICESLKIVDLQNPTIPLAVLDFHRAASNDPTQLAERVGRLRLVDDEGREVCHIQSDVFFHRLRTHLLQISDPSGRPLVTAGTEPVRVPGTLVEGEEPAVSYQGVIYLNNRLLGTGVRLAPPASQETPSTSQPAAAP